MATYDQESKEIMKEMEKEAGVADLLELYSRVEAVYVAASQASDQPEPTATIASNATNAR